MAAAQWAALNDPAFIVNMAGLAPNAIGTSFARARVGEAVKEPKTTTKTLSVTGTRGNFIGEHLWRRMNYDVWVMKCNENPAEFANDPAPAESGKDCRCP
jgi:hypothetical protein